MELSTEEGKQIEVVVSCKIIGQLFANLSEKTS